jgi:hypothetical protein
MKYKNTVVEIKQRSLRIYLIKLFLSKFNPNILNFRKLNSS